MRPIARALAAAALATATAPLSGCCYLAVTWGCHLEEVTSPPRLTRDTPDEAVDYLVDAFRRHAAREVYLSLDLDFVKSTGGFSLQEFIAGYTAFEPDFQADAERLAAAKRTAPVLSDGGTLARIDLVDGDASVTLYFRDRPTARVVVDDPDIREIEGPVPPVSEMVAIHNGDLVLRQAIPLHGQGDFVDPAAVRRVELHRDWLLYRVERPTNIRFVDRMREMKGAQE